MKVGEMFMALGFDVEDNALKSFDDKIQNLNTNMWAAAAAAAALNGGASAYSDPGKEARYQAWKAKQGAK